MRITAIRHMCSNGLCTLTDVLDERNIPYHYIDSYKDDLAVYDPLDPNPLIVLGGTCGVYQTDDYPFLQDEVEILERRMAADLPTLGICLGAQLMAKALGAHVGPGSKGGEIGWFDIHVNEAGQDSPVRHFDKSLTKMLQWHGDTFDLVPEMTLLASSDLYANQAFTYGRNCLGVQFHPEIQPCTLQEWYVSSAGAVAEGKLDLKRIKRDTDAHIDRLMKQSRLFFAEWLDNTGSKTIG